MKREVFLCDHCWRIVETKLRPAGALGNLVVPVAHRNARGQNCGGTNGEVIRGWDA